MNAYKRKDDFKVQGNWIPRHVCNNIGCFDTLSKRANLERLTVGKKTHMN